VNLSLLLLNGKRSKVVYKQKEFDLSREESRNNCFGEIRNDLKKEPGKLLEESYNQIVSQFADGELQELVKKHSYFKMLTKIEIKQAVSDGQFIQSHGVMHELCHQNQSDEIVRKELVKSKSQMETITKMPVTWFAYPNGDDAQPNLNTILHESGYKMAFSIGQKPFKSSDSPLFIPRHDARKSNVRLLF
jgi:hypothetical protein